MFGAMNHFKREDEVLVRCISFAKTRVNNYNMYAHSTWHISITD